jgi:hypothetical protein
MTDLWAEVKSVQTQPRYAAHLKGSVIKYPTGFTGASEDHVLEDKETKHWP